MPGCSQGTQPVAWPAARGSRNPLQLLCTWVALLKLLGEGFACKPGGPAVNHAVHPLNQKRARFGAGGVIADTPGFTTAHTWRATWQEEVTAAGQGSGSPALVRAQP